MDEPFGAVDAIARRALQNELLGIVRKSGATTLLVTHDVNESLHLSDRIVGIRADEAKNLRGLAQTYSNLTPRAAVAIFREMDDATAVKILFLMKPDIVGPIFEEMSKTAGTDGTLARRAAILSEKLRVMKAAATSAT